MELDVSNRSEEAAILLLKLLSTDPARDVQLIRSQTTTEAHALLNNAPHLNSLTPTVIVIHVLQELSEVLMEDHASGVHTEPCSRLMVLHHTMEEDQLTMVSWMKKMLISSIWTR